MPFTITVHGVGITHGFEHTRTPSQYYTGYIEHDTDFGISSLTKDLIINIDTTADNAGFDTNTYNCSIQFLLRGNVLRFSKGLSPKNGQPYLSKQLATITIEFAKGMDSIIALSYSEVDSFYDNAPGAGEGTIYKNIDSFRITSLQFNDTSIFSTDSSFSYHNISTINDDINGYFFGEYDYDSIFNDFVASSVTLSGIFRPTTFSEPAIVTEAPQPNDLGIYSSNGSIACSFDVSDHARDIEIFSPLGIREASFTIPAGRTEASLPHLPAGFYFVRLEGSMAKVYISD